MNTKFQFRLIYGLILIALILSTPAQISANSVSNSEFEIDTYIPDLDEKRQNLAPTISPSDTKASNSDQKTSTKSENELPTPFNPFSTSLTLSISSQRINYGEIMPGEPILRSLEVSTTQSPYLQTTLFILQSSRLTFSDSFIPDTSCDNGSCTAFSASEWQNPLTFGFGYRCDSDIKNLCEKSFSTPGFYKKISSEAHLMAPVLSNYGNQTAKAEILFKLNIPGTQPAGQYNQDIKLLLLPTL